MHIREVLQLRTKQYDRASALSYAHRWAFGRNPQYYDFEGLGGDCTNFASQVIYAGAGVMNPTPTYGWYYYSLNDRAPAWTSVELLHSFLVNNRGIGPVAVETDVSEVVPGDIAQLSFNGGIFEHSPVIVSVGENPSTSNILIAAHTFNADYYPLNNLPYVRIRFMHITHVNVW
jgi:hypothetical protein